MPDFPSESTVILSFPVGGGEVVANRGVKLFSINPSWPLLFLRGLQKGPRGLVGRYYCYQYYTAWIVCSGVAL